MGWYPENVAKNAALTIGTETSNAINVAIQLEDNGGADLGVRGTCYAYLSDDANGDSVTASAPAGGVAIGTDGLAIPLVAGKCWMLTSEADGDIDITLTHATGAATWYLVLVMPEGKRVLSDAITFAA